MEIRLRSYMKVGLEQRLGGDHAVIAAARVSTVGAESERDYSNNPEEREGLIRFLMKNRHGTPFEHSAMTFLVEAPIFVFREWHRHRIGWSYNEMSGRYKELEPVFWVPPKDRPLVQQGKPGHYTFVAGSEDQHEMLTCALSYSYGESYRIYMQSLQLGIAKEVARACLPVAIYSAMWTTCNPRSLMAFLSLRTKDERSAYPSFPMQEINDCAALMEREFETHFPLTYKAFNDFGRVCP